LETSTLCGHIFCEVCILGVINIQKKFYISGWNLLLTMSIVFTYNSTLNEKLLKMGVLGVAMATMCTISCMCMFHFFVLHLFVSHNKGSGIGSF